eukprot:TRINITY_DN7294_c0_g1_i1.p1 TRINITY_DN7294_c0_g1~~TRINITY_DN7294_c0_g1_i1.p1  ORF type:complete len:227 (-),score=53.01 TRINITY_DN7294_c0_g1_i1:407-1087(-)
MVVDSDLWMFVGGMWEMKFYDFSYKFLFFQVVIIGKSSVGKTNLLGRWMDDKFEPSTATISVEFSQKGFRVDGKLIKVQLWDTAGQEKFRSLTQNYYRNSSGCILVYDITDYETFQNLGTWLQAIRGASGNEDIPVILIGNKTDLESERAVPMEVGLKWSKENHLSFLETSAKSGNNVHRAFQMLLQDIYQNYSLKILQKETNPSTSWATTSVLVDQPPPNTSDCC